MSTKRRVNGPKRRGQTVKAQSAAGLAEVARATSRLWRKHHLSYDQTKYVVERARRALGVEPPRTRRRTVQRLHYPEVERLIRSAYRDRSAYGVMIKTLFFTGARVSAKKSLNQKRIWHRRPSARLIPWYGIGMREQASVLRDLSNVLGAVGLSHPKRVLKKVVFQYTKATRQVGRFFQERLRVTYKISPFIQVFVAQRNR